MIRERFTFVDAVSIIGGSEKMPILFAMWVDIFSIAENRKYTFFMYSKGKEFLNPKKISQNICSLYAG